MQQLSGLDTVFLQLESANMPMHIGALAIYDPSTAPGGHVRFKDILAYFAARLHKARSFRQRLARVPLGADRPYWIEDRDFDLEYHIRHIALPRPGDWRQLCIQAARLHARPLDMRRPLWEVTVVEGLDNVAGVPPGSFALVSKFHHAAVDGVSATEIAAAFHELEAVGDPGKPDAPWRPERVPGEAELLGRAALTTLRKPVEVAGFLRNTAPRLVKTGVALARGDARWPSKVPRTRFNGPISPHRVFDARRFSLDEVRAIKSAVDGATVNDVIVSVCGGALRRYLNARHELPERSLVAMAPVSVRTKAQRGAAGNQVSTLSLPIRTDISEPLARLRAVQKESVAAKTISGALGSNIVTDLAHLLPVASTQLAAQAYARWGLAERMPPVFNTVITNVPGPGVPLYSMGSRLVANFGLGPIVHGVGLFQPVLSYNGEITVSAVSCREMMPDPAVYGDCLDESFEALKKATLKPTAPRADASGARKVARKRKTASGASTKKKKTPSKNKKVGTSAAKRKTRARKTSSDS